MRHTPLPPCRKYRGDLDSVLDGVASVDVRHRVEVHAEQCPACAMSLRGAVELRRWIDSAPEPEPGDGAEESFVRGVFDRIDGMDRIQPVDRERSRLTRWGLPLGAVAAGCLAVTVVRGSRGDRPSVDDVPKFEVARAHPEVSAVPDPVESIAAPAAPQTYLEEPIPVDRVAFEKALGAIRSGAFLPDADLESRGLFSSLHDQFGTDGAHRGARAILRDEEPHGLAPLAARLLGPRADLGDRRLLARTLPLTGLAGALALAERGPSGLALLWDLACDGSESGDSNRRWAARALLLRAQAGEDPLRAPLDVSRNAPLAADLISASGESASSRLLELFLGDGRVEWLDAWATTPGRDASLAEALESSGRSPSGQGRERLLTAIERARFAPGRGLVIAAMEDGDRGAAAILGALPGRESVEGLMLAVRGGKLRTEVEDLAWAQLAAEQPGVLLDLMCEPRGVVQDAPELILSSLALIAGDHSEALRLLVAAGIEEALVLELRTRALLLAVESAHGSASASVLSSASRAGLHRLTVSEYVPLAAAAWLVCARVGDLPPTANEELLRTLERPATGAVLHLRVTRALERARARRIRRPQ